MWFAWVGIHFAIQTEVPFPGVDGCVFTIPLIWAPLVYAHACALIHTAVYAMFVAHCAVVL